MIARIALAEQAAQQILEERDAQAKAKAAYVAKTLRTNGLLLLHGPQARSRLLKALRRRGATLSSSILKELLSPNSPFVVFSDHSLPDLDDDLDEIAVARWAPHADLLLLPSYLFDLLQEIHQGDPEITSPDSLPFTTTLDRMATLRAGVFAAGERRDDIFASHFAPVLEFTRTLRITDTFLGRQVISRYLQGDSRDARGARWFFSKLASSGVQRCEVVTWRSASGNVSKEKAMADLGRAFSMLLRDTGYCGTVMISATERKDGLPHQRGLYFDQRAFMSLDKGLETFELEALKFTVTCGTTNENLGRLLYDYRRVAASALVVDLDRTS